MKTLIDTSKTTSKISANKNKPTKSLTVLRIIHRTPYVRDRKTTMRDDEHKENEDQDHKKQ
jgi:hypothetical protein